MSLSVKNSLSLSLSVSYIRTFLCCVSSRRARIPSQRVSNSLRLRVSPFHVEPTPFVFLFASVVRFCQISLLRFEIDRTTNAWFRQGEKRPGVASGRRFDESTFHSLGRFTYLPYTRIPFFHCLPSFATFNTSVEISKCDRIFLHPFVTVLLSSSDRPLSVCPCLFLTPLLFTLYLCLCPMTSRFRPFHSCSSEPKRNACRCFTANTDLHVHLAQYNTVSFSPLCKSWC